jgi:hypothetical protein
MTELEENLELYITWPDGDRFGPLKPTPCGLGLYGGWESYIDANGRRVPLSEKPAS